MISAIERMPNERHTYRSLLVLILPVCKDGEQEELSTCEASAQAAIAASDEKTAHVGRQECLPQRKGFGWEMHLVFLIASLSHQ